MFSDIRSLQSKLGYSFTELGLLQKALSHRSAGGEHNERLEFLGDSLVNMAVAELLYKRFPASPEGDLSGFRSLLVCRNSLAEIARTLNLGDYLVLGQGTLRAGGHRLDSILSDTYEAILGAIYLDSDWQQIQKIAASHFSSRIDNIGDLSQARDAKSRLQELLQAQHLSLPVYDLMETYGPGHSQKFKVYCRVEMLSTDVIGEGSSRRKAEQDAAEKVLILLQQAKETSE